MARLNIEDRWWTDPRRNRLLRILSGDSALADGLALQAWRLAQEHWKYSQGLVPLHLFETIERHEILIECQLVEIRGDEVYIRGSSDCLDWIREQRDQAVEAGKKSAQARKAKNGTAQPQKPERLSNGSRTESNDAEPSYSPSYSLSSSKSEKFEKPDENIVNFENSFSQDLPGFTGVIENLYK